MGCYRFTVIFLLISSTLFADINPICELILNDNEIAYGVKEGNVQCILTTDIKWKVVIQGNLTEAAQADYKVCIHMQYNRTCQVPSGFQCPGGKHYSEIENEIFQYKCYTGMYYVKVESELNGKIESNRTYFYCLTPPVKSYSEPYNYPQNNQRPTPYCKILNIDSNDRIAGDIINFQIWGNDPDGNKNYSVMYWKIMTKWAQIKPVHPPNYYAPAERNQYKTYIPYQDLTIQEWDTRDNLSDIGKYELSVYMIDEHGRHGAGYQKVFYTNGSGGEEPPVDTMPPESPKNIKIR